MLGQFVIIRCRDAGVHVGTLKMYQGRMVHLTSSRRLWSWEGANTLNEVATAGITGGRISEPVPEIILLDACEITPVSDAARETLDKGQW